MAEAIGQTLSDYRIVDKAEDTQLHRFVALKFPPEDVVKGPVLEQQRSYLTRGTS